MKQIDHDPNEPKPKMPMVWPQAWIVVALLWLGYCYFNAVDWQSIGLGFLTGGVLAAWAIDITGNKLPDFMVPKDVRRRRSRDSSKSN